MSPKLSLTLDGWPSFYQPISEEAVNYTTMLSDGKDEVTCASLTPTLDMSLTTDRIHGKDVHEFGISGVYWW